jgi:hypothetical protein
METFHLKKAFVHTDHLPDLRGSYPAMKTYNHSCDELKNSMHSGGRISNKFIRFVNAIQD